MSNLVDDVDDLDGDEMCHVTQPDLFENIYDAATAYDEVEE